MTESTHADDNSDSISTIDTKIGENTDATGTTTLFARLKQIVDNYLEKGLLNGTCTALPDDRSIYDFLLTSDNNYSTTGSLDFTTEKTVFEISDDTRHEIVSSWIDITPFTNTATITFQFYRSVAAAGGTYRKAGDTITKVVGTDNPIIEFADWAHYGYTKITAISDNAGDNSVDVPFGYIKKPLE